MVGDVLKTLQEINGYSQKQINETSGISYPYIYYVINLITHHKKY